MKILKKYQLIEEIGGGSFSAIYKAKDIYTNKYCAVKIEPKNKALLETDPCNIPLIVREAHIYNALYKVDEIPKLLWFGFDHQCYRYCMVLPLLTCSFRSLQYNLEEDRESWIRAGRFMLQAVKALHQNRYIHRDIKPDNFMFDENGKAYLIDLGLCKQFIRNGKHIAPRHRTSVIGTVNYISVNIHNMEEPSRRDDVESVCYVLWKICGGLDWDTYEAEDLSIIKDSKQSLVYSESERLPTELLSLLRKTKELKYEEEPCYDL